MINVPGQLSDEEVTSRGALSEAEILALTGLMQRFERFGLEAANNLPLVDALRLSLTVERYSQAIAERLTALVDKTRATRPLRISTAELLAQHKGLTARECNAYVLAAHRYTAHRDLHRAYAHSDVSQRSLNKVTHALEDFANYVEPEELNEIAKRLAPAAMGTGAGLGAAIRRERDRIAPANSERAEQIAKEQAWEKRHLVFNRGKYAVNVRGSIPNELAEPIIEAIMNRSRAIRARQINSGEPTTANPARTADALAQICAEKCENLPHIRRLLDLRDMPANATPAMMRQAIVLRYRGQFDLHREARLVSPQLREIVLARDGGCIFQPCHEHAAACEIHHVLPWREGGMTNASNLVALCPAHHAAFNHDGTDPNRYKIIFTGDGYPLVVPPENLDPLRRPQANDRFSFALHPTYHAAHPTGARLPKAPTPQLSLPARPLAQAAPQRSNPSSGRQKKARSATERPQPERIQIPGFKISVLLDENGSPRPPEAYDPKYTREYAEKIVASHKRTRPVKRPIRRMRIGAPSNYRSYGKRIHLLTKPIFRGPPRIIPHEDDAAPG